MAGNLVVSQETRLQGCSQHELGCYSRSGEEDQVTVSPRWIVVLFFQRSKRSKKPIGTQSAAIDYSQLLPLPTKILCKLGRAAAHTGDPRMPLKVKESVKVTPKR